jgi:hypothetical protein
VRYIKRFESNLGSAPRSPFTFEDIRDFLIDYIDDGKLKVSQLDDLGVYYFNNQKFGKRAIYIQDKKMDRFNTNGQLTHRPNDDFRGIYLKIEIPHPMGIKGSLDVDGYTIATLQYVFQKFINYSNDIVDTNIFALIVKSNRYEDPLSQSIVKIEFES